MPWEADFDQLLDEVDDSYVEYVPLSKRTKEEEPGTSGGTAAHVGSNMKVSNMKVSLLQQAHKLKEGEAEYLESEQEKIAKAEAEFIKSIERQKQKLMGVGEIATGVTYSEPLKTSWTAPAYLQAMGASKNKLLRKRWHIICEGTRLPPPIKSFIEMKLPRAIIGVLQAKGITRPTPIQIQGIPVALSGRDMIGVAFTGSGKTMVFALPMVMLSLDAETKLPFIDNEGPYCLSIAPSRELARQTKDVVSLFFDSMAHAGMPRLTAALMIGGISTEEVFSDCAKKSGGRRGVRGALHVVVGTPGRIIAMLKTDRINLESCRLLNMDEADRLLDVGFEDDVRIILSYFKAQRQTLLFSATMPQKIKDFAATALVDPVVVNVGRTAAANLDVVQAVEYVKREAKILYLLECLQKTPAPVIIFAENKVDVDRIHEYFIHKGVEAVAIHAGKDQQTRDFAIKSFREGAKDVMIATDIASKGLDFPEIQHVINFDMPEEIENYVHRIGRTGRGGKTGLATTFVNEDLSESTLMDLYYLLKDARQPIPGFVQHRAADLLTNAQTIGGIKGCAYCSGLGHRVNNCPKILKDKSKQNDITKKARLGNNDVGGEDY